MGENQKRWKVTHVIDAKLTDRPALSSCVKGGQLDHTGAKRNGAMNRGRSETQIQKRIRRERACVTYVVYFPKGKVTQNSDTPREAGDTIAQHQALVTPFFRCCLI